MKVRDMRLRRHGVVAIAVLGLMATAVVPASAERGGGGLGGAAKAAAFALDVDVDVLGALPLDVGPLARLRLSGDAGPRYANVAQGRGAAAARGPGAGHRRPDEGQQGRLLQGLGPGGDASSSSCSASC